MKVDYLTWIKNVDQESHGRAGLYNLASSGVYEPTEMLVEDIQRDGSADLRVRLGEPNPWGHPRLVEGIARTYGVADLSRVIVTSGASIALYIVCRALLEQGDEVIVEAPAYEPFLAAPESVGARVKRLVRRAPGFGLDAAELEDMITPRTRLVILSNLHNPSGALLTDETLRDVAAVARESDIRVIVDEVFHDFVADRQRPAATLDDCFISINSLSKVYGLSLLRCGWIIASPEISGRIRPVQVVVENIGSRLTEAIASIVFDHISTYRQHGLDVLSRNRATVDRELQPLFQRGVLSGSIPTDCTLLFPKLEVVEDTEAVVARLAARGVLVAPGKHFGAPPHLRIGFGGRSEDVRIGLARLADELGARRLYDSS